VEFDGAKADLGKLLLGAATGDTAVLLLDLLFVSGSGWAASFERLKKRVALLVISVVGFGGGMAALVASLELAGL